MANVLIIDDDPYLTDDLTFFLKDRNHQCKVYKRADDVMKHLDELGNYDVIILDIMMRKGTLLPDDQLGLETGELLFSKILQKFPNSKIIVISAMDFVDMTIDFDQYPRVEKLLKISANKTIQELLAMIS